MARVVCVKIENRYIFLDSPEFGSRTSRTLNTHK